MYCTNCGNEVDEKAIACTKCGVSPRTEKKFCHNCGVDVNANQAMCIKCGVSLKAGAAYNGMKKKTIAGICALVVGGLGVHKFYHGSWGWGILYILLFWTWIPMVLALIEGITYLTMDESLYDAKYNIAEKSAFKW